MKSEELIQRQSVKTMHKLTYRGYKFTITGQHEFTYNAKSKMYFNVKIEAKKRCTCKDKATTLKQKLDRLIKEAKMTEALELREAEFKKSYTGLTTAQILTHASYSHARLVPNSTTGEYYNIYFKTSLSPSGVLIVSSCKAADLAILGKSSYLPGEK